MTGCNKLSAVVAGPFLALFSLSAGAQQAPGTLIEADIPVSAAPSRALTPADLPPNPPKVTCDAENLTISAQNSTLAAVLYAIKGCTGAAIDIPEGASSERLYFDLGPGPMRTVLAQFLSSTDFNYVFGSAPDNPEKVETVLLVPRGKDGKDSLNFAPDAPEASPNRKGWMEARKAYSQSMEPAQQAAADDPDPAIATVPAESASAGSNPAADIPSADPGSMASATSRPAPAGNQLAAVTSAPVSTDGKGTQQMIQDMRQLFEQRKQMIQQQSSASRH